ncbi:MAG: YraN family protein [Epulopiscium sp.]|nr:YraN family protein [Candidatus Epulonipiscium sp.]
MKNLRMIGACGEDLAFTYLESLGYHILEKNFRCKIGEIDLIAQHNESIVFIEVKYRRTLSYGYPCEAVHRTKQKTISKVALYYLKKYNLFDSSCRFDVVEIIQNKDETQIHLIQNAFMV